MSESRRMDGSRFVHDARRNDLMGLGTGRKTRLATQVRATTALALALLTLAALPCKVNAGSPPDGAPPSNGGRPAKTDGQPSEKAKTQPGLLVNAPRAFQGYTLSFPLRSTKTYLVDMQGRVVR